MEARGVGRVRAIEWPTPGVVKVIDDVALRRPGPDDVVVDVALTVTSTGTELARFRSLPNAAVKYPHLPGFMAAGTVIMSSPPFEAGDSVAVRQVPHQSGVVAPRADVHAIPPGVDLVDGALWHLGLVALYGLRRGGYTPAEPLAVVGAGIVGAVARRLAVAMGTPECLVVAASDAKQWSVEKDMSSRFLAVSDTPLDDELARYPLTIDATGTADGLETAVALAGAGGRVVLLGSPRAESAPLPVRAIQERGVRVVGAHIGTLKGFAPGPEEELTETFFRLLAGGVSFSDLVERRGPTDAGNVYEVAAGQPSFVAAAFDWSGERLEPYFDPSPAADEPPLRFALIGCGDIGAQNALALQEAEGAQLTTIFDPIPDLAGQLAKKHRATAVDSLVDAVTNPDVDAVLIATPHDTHEEIVRASLAAGKHVLLEKPLAADLDSAVRITRMAEASDRTVAVFFFLRSDRRFIRAARAVESNPDGRPHGAASTYLSRKPTHYFTGGYSKRAPSIWRQSKDRAGGGVLIMNVLHHLDAVRALIGREAETVVARTAPTLDYPGIEDVATLIVDFGGALATFVGAASAFDGPGERVELWNPSLRIALLPDGILSHQDRESSAEADLDPLPKNQSRVDFISEFARAVNNGKQPDVAARDALAVQAIVTAAYVSAAEDRTVRIAEVLRDVGWQ
jgi:predicted dehydrogenase/threonine dehydrogenase-like Zn-dependent dehydrogenase